MPSKKDSQRIRLDKPFYCGVMMAAMLTITPNAWAWEVKSFYPSPLEPTLPHAEHARQLVVEPPWLLRTIRHAHQQSLQRSWQSISPPVTDSRQD